MFVSLNTFFLFLQIFGKLRIQERRRSRVFRAARLWCRKSLEGREFEAGLRHPTSGKFCLCTFFESGNDKGSAPPFISFAKSNPHCPLRILGYEKPIFYLFTNPSPRPLERFR